MNAPQQLRALAYTSSAHLCGINDYHQRVAPHVPVLADTLRLPADRVLRDRPLALFKQRLRYRALAAAADRYDVVLLQMVTQWNGFRLGEYCLPSFVGRLRPPLVLVLHEWPEPIGEEPVRPGLADAARRVATSIVRRADFGGRGFDSWIERVFLTRASHIVVHADHLADRLIRAGVAPERITFCVQPAYPIGEEPDRAALATVPANKRVVLLFGFPHPRKRYDIALRAVATLPPDVVLLMVGAADDQFRRAYVNELRQLAAELGIANRFIATGELADKAVTAIFSRTDVAVAPVGYATGSAALGYLVAAGLPIVASDVASMKAVADAGAGIDLFQSGNVDACAAALRRALDDPGHQEGLRRRSRQFAGAYTFAKLGALLDGRLRDAARLQAPAARAARVSPIGARS